MATFDPADHKVIATTSTPALGQAMKIMLMAMGFGGVEIVQPEDICKRAEELKPTFILYTPEYLTMPMAEIVKIGCPCSQKKECRNALTVIFLKKKTFESIQASKQIGFDGIIFADQSMDRLLTALETVYQVGLDQETL
ncbi:MAG: hypothetical protein OQK24_00350 [Magnetovibrio sp.]|nr:hypothetical protein [Magnetovibrio sp.]